MIALRPSLKDPIPEILHSWKLLSDAVEAHLAGQEGQAEQLFRKADDRRVWDWLNPNWSQPQVNVIDMKPDGDTRIVGRSLRDPVRQPPAQLKATVLARDGYRCRYCGIPVIPADIRKIAHRLYPVAVPWNPRNPAEQHAAFQCMWLQFDHVVPHSHGGRTSEENIVVSCALCNYGKDRFTLRQLGLSDPRSKNPEPVNWDGLKRLSAALKIKSSRPVPSGGKIGQTAGKDAPPLKGQPGRFAYFFLPGGWVQNGYLYTPPIGGKPRWFKLGPGLEAEAAKRGGVDGCRLACSPSVFRRRGLNPEDFPDVALPAHDLQIAGDH